MKIRLASPITFDSIVDGPGLRAVIWTQGCNHNCKGCLNPQTHDLCGGYEADTYDIAKDIQKLKLHRGVTLSGGEPFMQSEALTEVAKVCKANNLDVWVYTGYTFEQIQNDEMLKPVLDYVDVIVDGRFEPDLYSPYLEFRGSSNQRIIRVR